MKRAAVVILAIIVLAGAPFAAYRLGLLDRFVGTIAPAGPAQSTSPVSSPTPDNVTPGTRGAFHARGG